MQKKSMTRSAYARMVGVNPSTITRLLTTSLAAAAVGKNIDAAHPDAVAYQAKIAGEAAPTAATGLDALYEDAIKHCQKTKRWTVTSLREGLKIGRPRAERILGMMTAAGVTSESPILKGRAATKETKKNAPKAGDDDFVYEIPEEIESFLDWPLRNLYHHFGNDSLFVDWLRATKEIENINEKRLKNATTKGLLVSRELIKVGVIDPINSAHIKLLTDGAKAMARRTTAMHDADIPLVDIEKYIADTITSFIRPVKSKVARALKNA